MDMKQIKKGKDPAVGMPDPVGAPGGQDAVEEAKTSGHIIVKLSCLIVAFAIWLYVVGTDTSPFEKSLTGVPISLTGVTDLAAAGNMSVISGYDETVDLLISGKKTEVQDLTSEDIEVSVDVSALKEAGKYSLPVSVKLPSGVSLVTTGLTVDVYVDVNTTKQVPVVAKLDYVTDASYHVGEPVLSVTSVTVEGPELVLDTVAYAGLEVSLGRVSTSMTTVATPVLYDADGVKITNPYVRFLGSEVTVNIPVTTQKTLPLVAKFELPEMKNKYTIQIMPATATVEGDPAVLNALEELVVYTADKTVREGILTVSFPVLPDNIRLVDSLTSLTVRVFVAADG